MSIYVGNKLATLYKGDYGPAQLYKGDIKIAGYATIPKQGTGLVCADTYNDKLELTIVGRSEQTVTVQGVNLFDEARILPAQGWVRQSDGSYYVPQSGIPYGQVLWDNTDGYAGQLAITISGYKDGIGTGAGPYILITYTDGTEVGGGGAIDTVWRTTQRLTDPAKTVAHLTWSYGGGGFGSYVRDILIAASSVQMPYQPYIPYSPSPDYPSPIQSSENFDAISCGHDPAIATTAHITEPLRSVGDVADTIEVTGGKVEVVRRVDPTIDACTTERIDVVGARYILATPTRTDITATPLGQQLLAMRTQPHYTQVYTNAAIQPILRANIKTVER